MVKLNLRVLMAKKEVNQKQLYTDTGINKDTIDKVRNVDFVISGSYICMNDDYQSMIDNLR